MNINSKQVLLDKLAAAAKQKLTNKEKFQQRVSFLRGELTNKQWEKLKQENEEFQDSDQYEIISGEPWPSQGSPY